MAEKSTVLITGTSGYWGARVAARLLERPELHVIGVDDKVAEYEIKGLDFILTDWRNSAVVDLLHEEAVDAVCHLAFLESDRADETAFEQNVLGTMKLLGMCSDGGVSRFVFKSSTMVYGAQPGNSLFLPETHPLNGSRTYGYVRDLVEIETFCDKFRAQAPDMAITSLRFSHIVGPTTESPLTRFLREPEAFVLLGFDPLMQVIHEEDVVSAIVHAVDSPAGGAFNISSEGTMPLWKVMGLAGKSAAPVLHPLAYTAVSLLGPRYAPIDLDYVRYPCVGDLERMHSVLKFEPQHTGADALREFAGQQRLRRYIDGSPAQALDEEALRDTIERRRRARTSSKRTVRRTRAARRARGAYKPKSRPTQRS